MHSATDVSKLHIRENVPLSTFSTLRLGGNARYFIECRSAADICGALAFCRKHHLRWHVLGGGTNTIFADEGFDGAVIRVALRGIQFLRDGERVRMVAAAGEVWDDFVRVCINYNLSGIECLSGIPGLVGATPIQNVGAYGQEVSETIESVTALHVESLEEVLFTNAECQFGYRASRFNREDAGRYIIIQVVYSLQYRGKPTLRYAELATFVAETVQINALQAGKPQLDAVRNAVLALRRRKSMVIDAADPNSQSVGSFFKNPVLSREEFTQFETRYRASGRTEDIPAYRSNGAVKLSAAWLVEQAGFHKGLRRGGVGISSNHALALVNVSGTTSELLALAIDIQNAVQALFGIRLEREPVLVR